MISSLKPLLPSVFAQKKFSLAEIMRSMANEVLVHMAADNEMKNKQFYFYVQLLVKLKNLCDEEKINTQSFIELLHKFNNDPNSHLSHLCPQINTSTDKKFAQTVLRHVQGLHRYQKNFDISTFDVKTKIFIKLKLKSVLNTQMKLIEKNISEFDEKQTLNSNIAENTENTAQKALVENPPPILLLSKPKFEQVSQNLIPSDSVKQYCWAEKPLPMEPAQQTCSSGNALPSKTKNQTQCSLSLVRNFADT
tara:strand:+ start:15588 stop:16337 length:750 start_codon:yes stop_codon:yes gene_type:complete